MSRVNILMHDNTVHHHHDHWHQSLILISVLRHIAEWHMSLPEILLHFYIMVYFDLLQGLRNKYQLPPPMDLQIHQYRQLWSSLGAVLFGLYSSSPLQEYHCG